MRWDDTFEGTSNQYQWHDLLAGEGTDNDELLGYVRHNLTNGEFIAVINDPIGASKKFGNLEDAKAYVITHYVTQKLEGT
jgi:hypothetical protein